MRRYFCKCIVILLAFFCSSNSVDGKILPKNLIFGVDVGKFMYYSGLINQYYKFAMYDFDPPQSTYGSSRPMPPRYDGLQYEGYVAYLLGKCIFNVEIGFGNINWDGWPYKKYDVDPNTYKSKGYYVKYGVDFNFLKDTNEHNLAFLGLRHVISLYRDSLQSYIFLSPSKDSNYDTKRIKNYYKKDFKFTKIDMQQEGVIASWFEIVAGVQLKIFKNLFLGNNLRLKFWLKTFNDDKIRSFDVLGYGLVNDISSYVVFGYNLYVSFQIPISENSLYHRTVVDRSSLF